ncbi:DUF1120 domain-containing protein [Bacillus subtilis subsp. subtilis]|nr:DUF1120 domain-containing protein [Bacillus subtilis subsp. subtilis]
MRGLLLVMTVLLSSASAPALADGGVVRFSGRIVDPGCTPAVQADRREITFSGCPLAAQGARLAVTSLQDAAVVPLRDARRRSEVLSVASGALSADATSFSSRYRMEGGAALRGPYLVRIDYP